MPRYTNPKTGKSISSEKPLSDAELEEAFAPEKQQKPWYIQAGRTGLEAAGAIGGGIAGASIGPLGAIAGGGLGYAGAKGLADIGEEALGYKEPVGVGERTLEAGEDILKGGAMEAGGQVVGTVLSGIYRGGEKYINKAIDWGIEKGLRPSVVGKTTHAQYKKYIERAREAVKTIIADKDNLILTDESGNLIKGELPKSLKQFTEAIGQSKKSIFAQYDAMAEKAGGSKIVLNPIADELNLIAANKVVRDKSPGVAEYAAARAKSLLSNAPKTPLSGRVENVGPPKATYTASQAQEAIAHYNNSLEAYYKNPSYDNANIASVDAMIVNRLRRELDRTIEESVGPGYQQLKNTYGALTALEKDVTHRAIVDARKNIKGLIDFTDIFSGGQVITGIATGQPVLIGTGLAQKGIAKTYKWWIDPNRIVSSMFGKVEKGLVKHPVVSPETGRLLGTAGAYGLTPRMEE